MVVAPLCWKANEWVGMTIVCAMDAIIAALHDRVSPKEKLNEIVLHGPTSKAEGKISGLMYFW